MAAGKNGDITAKKTLITCDIAIRDCSYHYRFRRISRIHFIIEYSTMHFIYCLIKVAIDVGQSSAMRKKRKMRAERRGERTERNGM